MATRQRAGRERPPHTANPPSRLLRARRASAPSGNKRLTSEVEDHWPPAERHAGRRERLLARGRLTQGIRAWFVEEGFTEVETPALQVSPGNEAHLHAFSTTAVEPGGGERPLHLRTSPEFACKTLLAMGETSIFEIARVWRNRERGPLHHPEFTMLEWYRVGAPHTVLMEDCHRLLSLAAATTGKARFTWRGQEADPAAEPQRISVPEAFVRWGRIDLMASIGASGETDQGMLAAAASAAGVRVAADDTWSDIFSRVLVEKIEPRLGVGHPAILYDYPLAEAALARPSANDPRLAERFELYVCGVELANAFGELTDPAEQRRRFEAEMAEMRRVYGTDYPIDEAFLAALAHMPPASGAALGLDRLVMLATGASHIEEVLWQAVS